MNKDDMIKEMAEVIDHLSDKCFDVVCKDCEYYRADDEFFCCNSAFEATALYNAGYRKVLLDTNDGKAVDVVQYAPWQLIEGYTEREVKKARNETVREILQRLWEERNALGQLMILETDLTKLAKEYDIELE